MGDLFEKRRPRARVERSDEANVGARADDLLAVQHTAGNEAVVQLLSGGHRTRLPRAALQRQDSTASLQARVETPGGWFGENFLNNSQNELILQIAAAAIDNPVHKKCVWHYGRAKGAPLHLDRADMKAMNIELSVFELPAVSAAIGEADRELRDRFRDPEREQAGFAPAIPRGAEAERNVTTTGPALANASLARCTAHVDGKVIVTANAVRFEGTVRFTDRWDFDPDWLSGEHAHRTTMGELETIVGWALLPGEPFDVDTDAVNFRQDPGTGRAELSL